MLRHTTLATALCATSLLLSACDSPNEIDFKNTTQAAQYNLQIRTDPIDDHVMSSALFLKRKFPYLSPWWGRRLLNSSLDREEAVVFQCFPSTPDAMHIYIQQSHCNISRSARPIDSVIRFDREPPLKLKAIFTTHGFVDTYCDLIIPFYSAPPDDRTDKNELEAGYANILQYQAVVRGFRNARQRVAFRTYFNKNEFTIVLPLGATDTAARQFDELHEACKTNLAAVPFDAPQPAQPLNAGPQPSPEEQTKK